MSSNLIILIVVLFVAFSLVKRIFRHTGVQPNVANNAYGPILIDENPSFNRDNGSPLAILQRWQSGISYQVSFARNQNNPQGDSK